VSFLKKLGARCKECNVYLARINKNLLCRSHARKKEKPMRFLDRIRMYRLNQRIATRKDEIRKSFNYYYLTTFGFIPDWDYGAEIANDLVIYTCYADLERIISRNE
jgi:hypothetical protein